jgi:hypothetical protein
VDVNASIAFVFVDITSFTWDVTVNMAFKTSVEVGDEVGVGVGVEEEMTEEVRVEESFRVEEIGIEEEEACIL